MCQKPTVTFEVYLDLVETCEGTSYLRRSLWRREDEEELFHKARRDVLFEKTP